LRKEGHEQPFYYTVDGWRIGTVFLLTKARILSVSFFKSSELEGLIANGNFQIAETERLKLKQLRFYFVVANKI